MQDLELKELNVRGRKFTWSNDRNQTRIDRAFCSVSWDLLLPRVFLQALSSKMSYHYPLVIIGSLVVKKYNGFCFETFWPKLPRYQDVVTTSWSKSIKVSSLAH
jgi:hypothetical protein